VGSCALSGRLWSPIESAAAALEDAVRVSSAAPEGLPGRTLRLRWPGGYHVRLRMPGNAVPKESTDPLNIVDFTQQSPIVSTCLCCFFLPTSSEIWSASMLSVEQFSSVTFSVVNASWCSDGVALRHIERPQHLRRVLAL